MAAVIDPWPGGDGDVFPVDRLDEFLLWGSEAGGSDVAFQSGRPRI